MTMITGSAGLPYTALTKREKSRLRQIDGTSRIPEKTGLPEICSGMRLLPVLTPAHTSRRLSEVVDSSHSAFIAFNYFAEDQFNRNKKLCQPLFS
jgi:hypothetical protein